MTKGIVTLNGQSIGYVHECDFSELERRVLHDLASHPARREDLNRYLGDMAHVVLVVSDDMSEEDRRLWIDSLREIEELPRARQFVEPEQPRVRRGKGERKRGRADRWR